MTTFFLSRIRTLILVLILFHVSLPAICGGPANKNKKTPKSTSAFTITLTDYMESSPSGLIHATPDDPYNDDEAFHQALADVQAHMADGPVVLIIPGPNTPGGKWLVCKEQIGTTGHPYYYVEKLFELTGCVNGLVIRGELGEQRVYPTIQVEKKAHMGLFGVYGESPQDLGLDPNEWNILYGGGCSHILDYIALNNLPGPDPSQGIGTEWNCSEISIRTFISNNMLSAPSNIFRFIDCDNIAMYDFNIEGSSDDMVLGGQFSTGIAPYELQNHGIFATNLTNFSMNNIHISKMGGDGIDIRNAVPNASGGPDNNIKIVDCSFNENGRNGVSWNGGNGFYMYNVTCNGNANPKLKIRSNPGAGIDIEPESNSDYGAPHNACVNGHFENCHFMDNTGHGIALSIDRPRPNNQAFYTAEYTGGHTFINCEAGNTSNTNGSAWALLAWQRDCEFYHCQFYGLTSAVWHPYEIGDTIPNGLEQVFKYCKFTDCYNGNLVPFASIFTTDIDSENATMEYDTFSTYNPARLYDVWCGYEYTDAQPANRMHFNNCIFTRYNSNFASTVTGKIRRSIVQNCIFRTHIYNPGPAYTYLIEITDPSNQFIPDYHAEGCEMKCARTPVPEIFATPPPNHLGEPIYLCPGEDVTISGNTIGATWSVVGGTSQSITVSQPGDYYLTYADECGSTTSNHFIVITNSATSTPTISTGGQPTTFCFDPDHPVTLTATLSFFYQWYLDGNLVSSGIHEQTYVPTISGNYTVEVTGNCGNATSDPVLITISNDPPAQPTISPAGPVTICNGQPVTLTSSSPTGNTWYLNGTALGVSTQSYTTSNAGNYTVVVTNSCGDSDPSSATSITVSSGPAIPTISPAGSVTICSGQSAVLTSSSATGNTWYLNGTALGVTTQSYTANAAGNYTVTATNSCGTSAPSSATIVIVNTIPAVPTISPAGAVAICDGQSVVLTSSSSTGNTWYLNGTALGVTTQAYTVSAAGNYTVTATNSCGTSAASLTTTVTVNTIPAVPTISPAGSVTICDGQSVVLTSSSSTGNTWYNNGTALGVTTQSYTASAAGNYTVTATNTCGTSAASLATTVAVNTVPAAPTISPAGSVAICDGQSVVLTSSSSTGNTWYKNGTALGVTSQTYTATTAGNYTATASNTCGASTPSQATTVTVNSNPATPTISAGGPTTFCTPGTVTLTSSSSSNNQWSLNGTNIPNAGGQTYVANASGIYTVTVTNSSSCQATSAGTTVTVKPAFDAGTINGPTNICPFINGAEALYTSTAISASSYSWQIVGTTGTITPVQPNEDKANATFSLPQNAGSSMAVRLSVTNGCGSGTTVLNKYLNDDKPNTPAPIGFSPSSKNMCNYPNSSTLATLTITSDPLATGYSWTIPAGVNYVPPSGPPTAGPATLDGAGLLMIQVWFDNSATSPCDIYAFAYNPCGVKNGRKISYTKSGSCPGARMSNLAYVAGESAETSIYPNPSNGDFKILLGNKKSVSNVLVTVTDQFGETVYKANEKCNAGIITLKLKNKFASGVYTVTCIVNGEKTIKKIVISK
ncbi:MAG: T9SS type A sorting domain-containing protein [Ferruginibacter sp.]